MRLLNWFLQGLLLLVLVLFVYGVGPTLETGYFPVYSKFKILKATDTPEGLSMTIQYKKLRDCEPQGYGWFVGDIGVGRREVRSGNNFTSVSRPVDSLITRFVVIRDLKLEDLTQLYAEIYSRCHPLWVTRSVIYP
jgi:hypothetical protein